MSYIIDSDILIYFLNQQETVVAHFANHSLSELATTRMNATELLYGAYLSKRPNLSLKTNRGLLEELTIYEYGAAAADIFASEKAWLKQQGQLIDDMDLLIASICLANNQTLVTNNTKHFDRVRGLVIENWTLPRN